MIKAIKMRGQEFLNRIQIRCTRWVLMRKKFQAEDGIVIFSEARGGSTWLMELLATIPRTCINWEPLHPERGVVPKGYKLGWNPMIPESDLALDHLDLFRRILRYSVSTKWTRRLLTIMSTVKSQIVITKFVRANLLIPYLLKNVKFHSPPIFLLRHPIDVCISQIKAFDQHTGNMERNKVPQCINNERFVIAQEFMASLNTALEVKVTKWCLNNKTTLDRLHTLEGLTVVHYSDLLLDPHAEMKRILSTLHIEVDPSIVDGMNFRKPSKTDYQGQFISDPTEQLHKNFNKLDTATKDRIQRVFDHFNIELYDAYSPMPKKEMWVEERIEKGGG